MNTGWNHNIHYHNLILRAVPSPCDRALGAGCGQGLLTRQLATRAKTVIGIDLDVPDPALPNHPLSPTQHHLPPGRHHDPPLPARLLRLHRRHRRRRHPPPPPPPPRLRPLPRPPRPGGVLAILGLYRPATLADHALAAAALYDIFGFPVTDGSGEEKVLIALTFSATPRAGELDPDMLYRVRIAQERETRLVYRRFQHASLTGRLGALALLDADIDGLLGRGKGRHADLWLLKAYVAVKLHRFAEAERFLVVDETLTASAQGRLVQADVDVQFGRYDAARARIQGALAEDRSWGDSL